MGIADGRPGERALRARRLVLALAAPQAAWAALGIVRPAAYGFLLGPGGRGASVRVMAGADAMMAYTVAHAAHRGRPLRRRLHAGAASDLLRAALIARYFRDAPRPGRLAMIGASVAGAGAALTLRGRVGA